MLHPDSLPRFLAEKVPLSGRCLVKMLMHGAPWDAGLVELAFVLAMHMEGLLTGDVREPFVAVRGASPSPVLLPARGTFRRRS